MVHVPKILLLLTVIFGVIFFDDNQTLILTLFFIFSTLSFFSYPYVKNSDSLTKSTIVIVCTIICAATSIYIFTITDSSYYLWGDEGESLTVARDIIRGNNKKIFWGLGFYGEHPILASDISALFLILFGDSLSVIRASVMIPSILSSLGIFFIIRSFFGNIPAYVSLVTFLSGYYHFQFSHLSYNNLWLVPITIWPFWLVISAQKYQSPRRYFLAGLLSGISTLFTYQAIMITCSICVLVIIQTRILKCCKDIKESFIVGITAGLIPLIGSLTIHIQKILYEHVMHFDENKVEVNSSYISQKIIDAFMAPFKSSGSHYMHGQLFDPVSSVLYIIGILILIRYLHKKEFIIFNSYILMLLLGFSLMNVLSPYSFIAVTRVTYLCALVPLLIGVVVWQVNKYFTPRYQSVFAIILTASLLGINISKIVTYRMFVSNTYVSEWKLWIDVTRNGNAIVIIPDSHKQTWNDIAKMYGFSDTSHIWYESEIGGKLNENLANEFYYVSKKCDHTEDVINKIKAAVLYDVQLNQHTIRNYEYHILEKTN